ncbi:precorrin-8X methylmutase [Tropicimonas sp. IMCC6043]|nr:precorrin-8X methylmutase [Tropicimonas sp. IMCC6043]
MVDVAQDLRLSEGAVVAGQSALRQISDSAEGSPRSRAGEKPPPGAAVGSGPALPPGGTEDRRALPIFCDSEMVARGIIARALPEGVEPVVTLNDPSVPDLAKCLGTTRSAAATELWRDRLGGAIVAIGNAPTALFHLLEGLEQGWPKPALILAFPVGFVGAAESKQALADLPHGVPFVTLLGRRGGSAMAAAAVNALTLGLTGDGT